SYTSNPADIAAYGPLTDKDGANPLTLTVVRVADKGLVARVKSVADRNGAEALKLRDLYVVRSKLPKANDAEYYHADLIGLHAFSEDGQPFGRVIAVQNFGAGDLLEIRRPDGNDVDFIPFTNACVPDVDIASGRLTVVPPVMTGEPEQSADDVESGSDA
ncbi:MAG: ribosome maturation factor RimM, partial [Hyphomicrobium sp.]